MDKHRGPLHIGVHLEQHSRDLIICCCFCLQDDYQICQALNLCIEEFVSGGLNYTAGVHMTRWETHTMFEVDALPHVIGSEEDELASNVLLGILQ